MKKIPTLFERDWAGDRSRVLDVVNPEAQWVIDGQGVATIKWDGTACLVRDGRLYKRYDAKAGRTPPATFEPAQDKDPETGHQPGWIPVGDEPDSKWFKSAWDEAFVVDFGPLEDGTYELVGPHFQSNPYGYDIDVFVPHGKHELLDAPRDFDGLRDYFGLHGMEGIVWHHPDGRMAKVKSRDLGLPWPLKGVGS